MPRALPVSLFKTMFDSSEAPGEPHPGHPRLLGDIGGTHARLGWQPSAQAPLERVQVLRCADHPGLAEALQHYLATQRLPRPACAALAMANPVTGDMVRMTNHHWAFSIGALRRHLGLRRLLVLNDFTALALSLPGLPAAVLRAVGGGQALPGGTLALLGPGTGLGVSGLSRQGAAVLPLSGEGGHVSLAVADAREFALLEVLQRRFGHVSAERVLSGSGLLALYQAMQALAGAAPAPQWQTPAEVMAQGLAEPDSLARQTLDQFCAFLGSVAGNLALTLGARGGVFIGGGIVPRMGALFEASPFRRRFEDKGRFGAYLQQIPTWVIDDPLLPALQGASLALDRAG